MNLGWIKDCFICMFKGHEISYNDEMELLYFDGKIRTICERCHYPLMVFVRATDYLDEDDYYIYSEE